MIVGYARVSTDGQTLDAQQAALAGKMRVVSGAVMKRPSRGGGQQRNAPSSTLAPRDVFPIRDPENGAPWLELPDGALHKRRAAGACGLAVRTV